jgi:DNA primase
MPSINYGALRRKVPIRRVLELVNFQPSSRRGDQWRGACPLPQHPATEKRDPTFSVNIQRNIYYCHRCKTGGNQLELWAAMIHCGIYDAAVDLCHKLHIDIKQFHLIRNLENTPPRTTSPATTGTR